MLRLRIFMVLYNVRDLALLLRAVHQTGTGASMASTLLAR